MMKDFFLNSKIKVLQTIITLVLFLQISSQSISNCNIENSGVSEDSGIGISLEDTGCFNKLETIEGCREGQITEDKDGNLFMLCSTDYDPVKDIFFYGLNKNGESYFAEDFQNQFKIIDGDDYHNYGEHSKSIFLDIEDDNKKYLLRTTGYDIYRAMTELFIIDETEISFELQDAKDIFSLGTGDSDDDYISDGDEFSVDYYQYYLIKSSNENNKYFLIFAQENNINIKKFEFNGPTLEDYHEIATIKAAEDSYYRDYSDSINVISCFLMENKNLLILFYVKAIEDDNGDYEFKYTRSYFNLNTLVKYNEEVLSVPKVQDSPYYFKGIPLNDAYCAFFYFTPIQDEEDEYWYHYKATLDISILSENGNYKFNIVTQKFYEHEDLSYDTLPKEFTKINEKRLVFITKANDQEISADYLMFILFNIIDDSYSNIEITMYKYYIDYILNMATHIYNGFLAFFCSINGDSGYYSNFFLIGYPYGEDETKDDISAYLDKTNIGTTEDDNIFIYLMNKKNLENNLFKFEFAQKIRLVSMSPEIRFFNVIDGQQIGPLSANSFFGENHLLKENKNLIRTSQYYNFMFQYVVKDEGITDDIVETGTSPRVFYGRTNTLKFQLCPSGDCPSECSFDSYINKECTLTGTDQAIIEQVQALISIYDDYSKVLSLELRENVYVELTNDKKEKLLEKDSNLPWIDLGECAQKIRNTLSLSDNIPLIILKYGTTSDLTYENYFTYEVYRGDTHAKIDLSICKDNNINTIGMVIEPKMKKNVANSVESMVDQGYNPFDINDKFYREICTPYDSPDGTDVLLDDREEYYYSSINTITCPDNCNISSYPLDNKYLKCNCPIEEGETLNLKHMTGKNVANSFKTTFKNSNWKAMICYKLVFDKEIFPKNIGSILSLILFIIYLGFFIYYLIEGITPLQDNIAEMMSSEQENKNEIEEIKSKEQNPAVITFKNPPKKPNSRNNDNKDKDNTNLTIVRKSNDIKIVELDNDKNEIKTKKDGTYTEGANLYRKKETEMNNDEKKYKNLDDFELNNLEYLEACKYDKRSFLKVYWSVLKREHIILFTFVSRNDYNLFYVKIERFLILLCTQMFMNGLFFMDDSMHKATKSDDYNFGQQLPKIIFSIIGTHVIEVLLCYLSMTDTVMYEVKELAKRKYTEEVIGEKVNTMKRKLIAYFIITFILFAFYWYFISAFCAVYQNTQKIFLLDFLIGTLFDYIVPFIIYLLKVLIRYLSIAKLSNKTGEIVYKISDLIPIF